MKKMLIIIMTIALIVLSVACTGGKESQMHDDMEETQQTGNNEEEKGTIGMTLKINGKEVNVKWEDNGSVRALADLASEGPITIDTSLYGGFEQVGGLGTTLPNNDVNTTTEPGDIVLYNGNNIVVFFGTNTWAYTRLGHIEGKNEEELKTMLGSNSAVLTITLDQN